MSTATSAWKDATNACLEWLAQECGYQVGVSALRGDRLPTDKANVFTFLISGGDDMGVYPASNATAATPMFPVYTGDAFIVGQFDTQECAYDFAGLVENNMPGHKTGTRGLDPNVRTFQLKCIAPRLESIDVPIDDDESMVLYVVRLEATVVYDNSTT